MPRLKSILSAHKGDCVVQVCYANSKVSAKLQLGRAYWVRLDEGLMLQLNQVLAPDLLALCYE